MFHTYHKKVDVTVTNRASSTFTPIQLAQIYGFPAADGTGQKVGIIELGGGYAHSDIQIYFNQLSINATPNLVDIGVDGATNDPFDGSGANVEVLLDIEIIAAIVPKAQIRVYFAPNSFQGFYDAILQAKNDGCQTISISWGAAEQYWPSQSLTSYNTLFSQCASAGITVTCAAGDNGSSDGAPGKNCDFPASSPFVLACGGTTLVASGSSITSETVWNNNSTTSATGGGISKTFAKPDYQAALNINGRGVPDIAGDADPNTGYICYGEGSQFVVGGTSAVSPLWAALVARLNQITSASISVNLLHTTIYQNPSFCRDVVTGNNGAYSASQGWDACTGFGSPNQSSIMVPLIQAALSGTPTPNPPTAAPVAKFSASPTKGKGRTVVTFTNNSVNAVRYLWNFGDGTPTSTETSPIHVFSPGTFTVSLTAYNSADAANTQTRNNYIKIAMPPPIPSFIASPTNVVGNSLLVHFQNTSQYATRYFWSFGDNRTSTASNPSHLYNKPGNYSVSLIGYGPAGYAVFRRASYIRVTKPHIVKKLEVSFLASTRNNTKVNFKAQSTGGRPELSSSYHWNFGDSQTSTLETPSHVYTKPGLYEVTLIVKKGTETVTSTRTLQVKDFNVVKHTNKRMLK